MFIPYTLLLLTFKSVSSYHKTMWIDFYGINR